MIEVGLELIAPCNYSCYYCSDKQVKQEAKLHDLDALEAIYEKLPPALTVIYCGGGEPTLHPQLGDILNLATQTGSVYFWTNMTIPVQNWVLGYPECMFVDATLHPQATIEAFDNRLREARNIGINVRVTFVGEPSQLECIPELRVHFETLGFPTAVFAYRGGEEVYSLGMERRPVPPPDDAPGRECIAGYSAVFIRHDSKLYRCARTERIEGLTAQPTSCDRECNCSLQLHDTQQHTERFREICQQLT